MKCSEVILFLCFACLAGSAQEYIVNEVDLSAVTPDVDVTRIIGGTATTIERFPYAVQLLISNQLICGGTILSRRHVLTAAHCFFDLRDIMYSPSSYSVVAGTAYLNRTGGTAHRVSTLIVHENYNNPIPRDNDIGIMVLSSNLALSTKISTASIPIQGYSVPDNTAVSVIGWGRTNAGIAVSSAVLQQASVMTINRSTCFNRYRQLETLIPNSYYPVTNNMICTGLIDVGGKDACQGDSGGPVLYGNVVIGITSWGYGCAHPTYPGVNARVATYTDWIKNVVARYNSGSRQETSALLLLAAVVFNAAIRL